MVDVVSKGWFDPKYFVLVVKSGSVVKISHEDLGSIHAKCDFRATGRY